jgi:hypothetical protein
MRTAPFHAPTPIDPFSSERRPEGVFSPFVMQRANNASLAESPIEILLWDFPLNSHFAGTVARSAAIQFALHRGRAPPVIPPSITSSAPVM